MPNWANSDLDPVEFELSECLFIRVSYDAPFGPLLLRLEFKLILRAA
jgi:hypothetical protein